LVRGAEDAAAAQGFMLATFNTDDRVDREKQVLDILRARRVDGVLLVVALPREDTAHVQLLQEAGMPIVCLDRQPRGLAVDSVTVDNAGGVREAILHLVAQGARRIAYLGGQRSFYIAADRLAGYRAALREARIPFETELVREGDFRRESGFRMGGELLNQNPDAIFSANILMTLGVLDAMEKRGLSPPRDLLLATFDYLALMNAFHPRLTAVAQPSYRIGYEGAGLLIERIRGKRVDPVQLVLPTTLEIGETTGAVQREVCRAS
jgi:DNA-binding LacI/PurR family transcriptional regulator